jgi:hypothetical protein
MLCCILLLYITYYILFYCVFFVCISIICYTLFMIYGLLLCIVYVVLCCCLCLCLCLCLWLCLCLCLWLWQEFLRPTRNIWCMIYHDSHLVHISCRSSYIYHIMHNIRAISRMTSIILHITLPPTYHLTSYISHVDHPTSIILHIM